MNSFFDRRILIETNRDITIEEEGEIRDLVKQVLTRKHENRKVKVITDFVEEQL